MPVYEYRCTECGEKFEKLVRSFTQQVIPTCPKCGSTGVNKAVSLFGVGGADNTSTAGSCVPTGT
jgi:putative FmdB family regulatory protein